MCRHFVAMHNTEGVKYISHRCEPMAVLRCVFSDARGASLHVVDDFCAFRVFRGYIKSAVSVFHFELLRRYKTLPSPMANFCVVTKLCHHLWRTSASLQNLAITYGESLSSLQNIAITYGEPLSSLQNLAITYGELLRRYKTLP